MGYGKNAGAKEASLARREEQERQQRIREGTTKVENTFDTNFGDNFFSGLRDNYLAYAQPQLVDQYDKAKNELAFALSRAGVTDSSIAGQKSGDLEKLNALRARELADKATGYETAARNNVEQARSELINTLNVTGDAEGAANSAISRAAILAKPPEYSPLEHMFTSFTDALGTQAAFERAYALGSPIKPTYNTGLFGRTGSVRNY